MATPLACGGTHCGSGTCSGSGFDVMDDDIAF